MTRFLAIGGLALLLIAITATTVPMWMMLAGMGMSIHGYAAVFLTVFFSFAVGGGLMFLVFYSARHGIDDAAHQNIRRGPHDDPELH
jgi:hypothetical protein